MDSVFIVGMLASSVRFATPLLFSALGETLGQRAGVLNVGLEGIMLVGAFLAAAGAAWTGSPWGGLALAVVGGTAAAAIHALFSITLRANQIVSGIAIIVLGLGLSSFGYRITIGSTSTPPAIPTFDRLEFWGLNEIPVVGPVLFQHHLLVYLAVVAAVALWWFLKRTGWGLEIRAIGESPAAADSVGIGVNRIRYLCVLFGGAMAAIGGAYLSVAQIGGFVENMVAGRGFIAIACVVFGRWNPLGVLLATLFFGAADAAQIRLQTALPNVPYQFFVMMPYLLAIVALVFFARRTRLPAALGIPFSTGR